MLTVPENKSVTRTLLSLLSIFLLTLPYGIVVNWVMVPHAVVGGGLTGVCEILYFASHTAIPMWLSQFVLNLSFLVVAYFTVGWQFCARTIFCVACQSLWLKILPILSTPLIADPFIALMFSAIINGFAMGIIFLNNGSTGGTDIIAVVINRFRHWPMGRILFCFDICIMCSAYFLPEVHSIERILYALAYTFAATSFIDATMFFLKKSSEI